jgi:hypothetical protein
MIKLRRSPALSTLTLLVVASGCESGLTDINRNPNQPEAVPPANLLASGIWNTAVSGGSAGSHNSWTLLYHTNLWSQHLAQPVYFSEDRYATRVDVIRQIWDNAYSSALTDLQEVKRMADPEQPNLWAIAEIMSVYNFLLLTDFFGDIPYSEALRLAEGIQQPRYDSQQTIYPDLLRRLGEAVARINPGAGTGAFATGDLVYGGNAENWRRFGNSLRLRVAMRVADTDQAAQARAAFAAAWGAGTIQNNAGNAQINWPGNPPAVNDLFRSIVQGGRTGDFRLSRTLVDTLQNRADPRLRVYAEPAAADGVFRGLPNGMPPATIQIGGAPSTAAHYSTIGSRFLSPTFPAVFMSRAEVLFLGAEAAARGWIAADPAALYREGVEASLREHGIGDAAITTYLARPDVQYAGLPSIHLQKWIALYFAGPEVWNEYRRTNTPRLTLAANASEPDIPQRLPYPAQESLYNPQNFPANVRITTPVWWSARARGIPR